MDWISFFWGVGALLFINTVYSFWIAPKVIKRIQKSEKEIDDFMKESEYLISDSRETLKSLKAEQEESIKSWDERAKKIELELEKSTASRLEYDQIMASVKLRKTCPACGVEFHLYIMEEEKVK